MRVAIYTLGCKVNQFESLALSEEYERLGCQVVPAGHEADLYVINTCAVTGKAAYQSRQYIRRILKRFPDARVLATGCYVQVGATELLERIGPRICMAGNDMKADIPRLSTSKPDCLGIFVGDVRNMLKILPLTISRPGTRSRVYLKVQDGCDAFCSYCIVPYARGRSRSMPAEEIERQVEQLTSRGAREIVITGIHVGHYGKDLPEGPDLLGLLKRLCSGFPDVWFRLSSIEPTEVGPDFLAWAASAPNFCRHFHVPLQSGSERVLRHMNRRYRPEQYAGVIEAIRGALPDACIGADVMAGFPTETQEDFEESVRLIEALPISYIHAFPYSRRPGTKASGLKSRVTRKEAERRARILRAIGEEKRLDFYRRFLGQELDALVEGPAPKRGSYGKKGMMQARTSNYLPVQLPAGKAGNGEGKISKNSFLKVRITGISDNLPVGEAV